MNSKSYDNESYARKTKATDNQWAHNADSEEEEEEYEEGSEYDDDYEEDSEYDHEDSEESEWDDWGRDQDLEIDESYDNTHAKSYGAESYDEWDNGDDDYWNSQAWNRDYDD